MKTQGFTLLEILISVGILAVVGVLITQVFFSITRTSLKADLLKDVKQNGDFVLDVMERYIRNSSASVILCDEGAESARSAVFQNRDGSETSFMCVSDGGAARIAAVSTSGTAFLSSGSYTISNSGDTVCDDSSLSFSCPDLSGLKTPVTIRFTLSQIGQPENVYESVKTTFEASVAPRN